MVETLSGLRPRPQGPPRPLAPLDFVARALRFFPFPVRCIQADHGLEFTYLFLDTPREHPLDTLCQERGIHHTLIPVATPRSNGQVERSHRTDMEEFYRRATYTNLRSLRPKIHRYTAYDNHHRPHMAIDMLTPIQKLRSVNGYETAQLNNRCDP